MVGPESGKYVLYVVFSEAFDESFANLLTSVLLHIVCPGKDPDNRLYDVTVSLCPEVACKILETTATMVAIESTLHHQSTDGEKQIARVSG